MNVAVQWPVTLVEDRVTLRPLRQRDRYVWEALRRANAAWLERWEATSPTGEPPTSFRSYVRSLDRSARAGTTLPFVMELDGELVGQLTLSSITRGSFWSATIGYWISQHVAGRGVTPLAVAMVSDFAWFEAGLHRIEINIRPENAASLRVVDKLGFRDEGLRRRFLHIQGDWRDHRSFALTAEEVPGGLVRRWRERGGTLR
ncbi:ribosomal-protein-alanine N-acetyltransferase [Georgenia soli]|uniref:Ribosomal-protein-alanine N-acetyltransferase n=1 Tax=Georgenia soli TaxID=638953 RepID=A0A2A9EK44_9MICO|nr:GNAT family protein [Georgenia soli]PFG38901.1 ribosomal-protein-alanine N-acetyltransferase [Georgenia soli]